MTKLSRITILLSFCLGLPLVAHGQDADPDLARMVDVFGTVMRNGAIEPARVGKEATQQKFGRASAFLAKDGTLFIASPFGVVSWGRDGKVKLHSGEQNIKTKRPGAFRTAFGHKRARKTTTNLPTQAFEALQQGAISVRLRSNGIGFGSQSYTAQTRPLDIRLRLPEQTIDLAVMPGGRLQQPRITKRVPFGFQKPAKKAP